MDNNIVLSKNFYIDAINAVDSIRNKLTGISKQVMHDEDYKLILKTLSKFSSSPTIEIFLRDCRKCLNNAYEFKRTRDFIFSKKENFVISFFSAPYNKTYGLDAFVYDKLPPDTFFIKKINCSYSETVDMLYCTVGFSQYPATVALFPENFSTRAPFKDNFSVFYFINIFDRRFLDFSLPTIRKNIHQNLFWRIRRIDKKLRIKAYATWLYLHEYFHSIGKLPLTDYLHVKSTKETAALEESRVDALSIIECITAYDNGCKNGLIYAELILFERMIRYLTHFSIDDNYDAKASYLLLSYMSMHNSDFYISEDNKLNINKYQVLTILNQYIDEINGFEKDICIGITRKNSKIYAEGIKKRDIFIQRYSSQKILQYITNIKVVS